MLSSLGLLTHRFFRIRKKHARCLFGNCIGRFTIDFESIFFALFSILENERSDARGVRLIKVLEMHFLETVVRASILFLLVLFYRLLVSLSLSRFLFLVPLSLCLSVCLFLCLCPSLFLSLSLSLSFSFSISSSSRPCRARCI